MLKEEFQVSKPIKNMEKHERWLIIKSSILHFDEWDLNVSKCAEQTEKSRKHEGRTKWEEGKQNQDYKGNIESAKIGIV